MPHSPRRTSTRRGHSSFLVLPTHAQGDLLDASLLPQHQEQATRQTPAQVYHHQGTPGHRSPAPSTEPTALLPSRDGLPAEATTHLEDQQHHPETPDTRTRPVDASWRPTSEDRPGARPKTSYHSASSGHPHSDDLQPAAPRQHAYGTQRADGAPVP